MIIIQQPDALSLLGNLKHLIINATSTEEVTMEVFLHGDTEAIVTHTYSPDPDGRIDVDLKDIVGAHLSFLLTDTSEPYQQVNIVRIFDVELHGNVQEESIEFAVVRAGVDNLADTPVNFFMQNFLTWQPTVKPVTYYTPEFLTYYAQNSCVVKCRAYNEHNTATTVTLASIGQGECWTIPVGYSVIAGKMEFLPSYYDVWIESSGTRLTYIQRYYANDVKSEQEEWILFENSLGGIDTFRAYGDSENSAEHEHKVAEVQEMSEEYRVDTTRKHKKSTGYLDKYERRWLLDFFPSLRKYVYAGSAIRRIVVTDDDANYNAKDLPSEYNFTYKYADATPYLNLPRTEVSLSELHIEVPDVGSFTIAPRLVEFPRIQLSGGALLPVQSPYSQEWGSVTLAALAAFLSGTVIESIPGQSTDLDLVQALIQQYSDNRFLSRLRDDVAKGHITFEKGLTSLMLTLLKRGATFGDFVSGTSGGYVDRYGNAELESLVLRTFLEAPEYRINSVSINVGDDYHTNGRGLIERVEIDTDGQGNQLNTGTFWLHLEDGVPGAVAINDRCKGIVNTILEDWMAETSNKDDGRGNRAFHGFYTTFFQIDEVRSMDGGINNVCRYHLRPTITVDGVEYWQRDDGTSSGIKGGNKFHPVQAMTFAQYSNPTNRDRQSAKYSTVGMNTYTRFLRNMTGWDEDLSNIAFQIGNTQLIADAFPRDSRAAEAGKYSVWLDGSVIMSGLIYQVDSWGREVVTRPDQGNWVATGAEYYYHDLVHYGSKIYECVYAETDANGKYLPLSHAHNGTNCVPGSDEHWMVYLYQPGITPGGSWKRENTPYAENKLVTLGTSLFISKAETSNSPLGLLRDGDGKYILNENGGYIIADDAVSDDWQQLFSVPDLTRGEDGVDAIVVNLTNDTDTVYTDEAGNVIGDLPTTQGQLFEGTRIIDSGITWAIDWDNSYGCTATINSTTGLVTVTSMTAGRARIRVTAIYGNDMRHKDFTFSKMFGKDKMWLVPSANVVKMDPNQSTTTFTPARITVGAYINRGNGKESVASDSLGYVLYSRWNESTGQVEKVKVHDGAVIPITLNSFFDDEFTIELYDTNDVLQDCEVVPLVRDGLNGRAVQAQYSEDGENWHGSFGEDDKFMRIREEGGQWGDAVKVVGEDGEGARYDFNVSKDKVSASVSTPPANCYHQEWQDAPIMVPFTAPDQQVYQYLWMRMVKVDKDGIASDARFIRLTGEDGKDGKSFEFVSGGWRAADVPYPANWVLQMAGTAYISKVETSNPPLGLLRGCDGEYMKNENGGYIIASDAMSDDWDIFAAGGTSVRIKSKETAYAISDSGKTPPLTGWTTILPALQQGQWLWTRRRTAFTDGTSTEDYSVSYAGIDPDGIYDIRTDFAKTTDTAITMPRDDSRLTWVANYASLNAQQGDFVWTRVSVIYDNDGRAPVVSYLCSRIGIDGKAVIGMEEFYCLSNQNESAPSGYNTKVDGVITPSGDWSENYPTQEPPYIYIWNFELTTFSDGTQRATDPRCLNPNGKDIRYIINEYALSACKVAESGRTYPADIDTNGKGWTDEILDRAPTETWPYQWNRETVHYTDGTRESFCHVSAVIGPKGDRGVPGAGFDWADAFKAGHPYEANNIVRLGDRAFIALVQTSNPPLGLMKNEVGLYLKNEEGGYIIANDTVSDDWSVFSRDGSDGSNGLNAIFVDFTNDNLTVRTDADGNPIGDFPTTTARLFDGSIVDNDKVAWIVGTRNCTASIDTNTGIISISGITAGTDVVSAYITAVATYKGAQYSKTITLNKSMGAEDWWVDTRPSVIIQNPDTGLFSSAQIQITARRWVDGKELSVKQGTGFVVINGHHATNLLKHDGDIVTVSELISTYGMASSGNQAVTFDLYKGENYDSGNWTLMDSEDLPVIMSGRKGDNAIFYELVTVKTLSRNKNLLSQLVTVAVRITRGESIENKTLPQMTAQGYSISVTPSSPKAWLDQYDRGFCVNPSLITSNDIFYLSLFDPHDIEVANTTIAVVENGQSFWGITMRPRGEWETGKVYRNDEDQATENGARFIDFVLQPNQSNLSVPYTCYMCKTTHTSSGTLASEVSNGLWEEAQGYLTLFTMYLVAMNAHIRFGSSNEITILNASNEIVAGLTGGNSNNGQSPVRFWAGTEIASVGSNGMVANVDLTNAPFQVRQDGSLISTKGTIGGVVINNNGLGTGTLAGKNGWGDVASISGQGIFINQSRISALYNVTNQQNGFAILTGRALSFENADVSASIGISGLQINGRGLEVYASDYSDIVLRTYRSGNNIGSMMLDGPEIKINTFSSLGTSKTIIGSGNSPVEINGPIMFNGKVVHKYLLHDSNYNNPVVNAEEGDHTFVMIGATDQTLYLPTNCSDGQEVFVVNLDNRHNVTIYPRYGQNITGAGASDGKLVILSEQHSRWYIGVYCSGTWIFT